MTIGLSNHEEALSMVEKECLRCGRCTCVHSASMLAGNACFGDLAASLLSAEGGTWGQEVIDAVFGCDQCGYCLRECPMEFDCKSFIVHARGFVEMAAPEQSSRYEKVRVDRESNLFSKLKKALSAEYDDTLNSERHCEKLFLPSCHMSAKFPELTKAMYSLALEHGLVTGMTDRCCGNPLFAAGLTRQAESYVADLGQLMDECGVRNIVTPCPNCFDFVLRMHDHGYWTDIEPVALPQALADAGVRVDAARYPELNTVAVHDSCPDRTRGIFAQALRTLLADFKQVELPHSGKDTLCCGCGGLSPFYGEGFSAEGVQAKIADFAEVNADAVMTTCFNCYDSLCRRTPMVHIAELVCDCRADVDALDRAKSSL